jgi:hypothetical protein
MRGVINTYPERRPDSSAPSDAAAADAPMHHGTSVADENLCVKDVLGMLEAESLNQVGTLLLHLQVRSLDLSGE